jgi:short-subunit dehydrogenase
MRLNSWRSPLLLELFMSLPPKLAEQVILITGASTGIGAAIATALAERYLGIRLVLAARRVDRLNAVATNCEKAGAEVLAVPTDMAQTEQAQGLAHQALEHFGRVDILVNNAGYGQMGPLELMPAAACRRQFEVNLLGPLALTQGLIPSMRDRGGGRIINISSIGGRTAFPLGGLYSGSKFALEAFSDTLRMELEPFNIRVIVVEPGAVHNEFLEVIKTELAQVIPDPQQTPYRAAFAQFASLEEQTKATAWTSEQVAEVVLRAMTAHRPRPRYVAATAGGPLVFLLTKVLPTRIVDRFWQHFYGIDQIRPD